MAPSSRGRRGKHGLPLRGTKGSTRGGTYRPSKGGAKGSKGSELATKNDTFYPTRVDEQTSVLDSGSEEDIISLKGSDRSVDASEDSSDSGYDDLPPKSYGAYNSLVESLGATRDLGGPRPKRQKLNSGQTQTFALDSSSSVEQNMEEDADENSELEVVEDLEMHGSDYLDETDADQDPFTKHFSDWDEAALARSIDSMSTWCMTECKSFTQPGWITRIYGGTDQPSVSSSGGTSAIGGIEDLCLKEKLKGLGQRSLPQMDEIIANLAAGIFNYKDILFPQRTLQNADTLRKLCCLHSLNHLFKTRDRIIKNNARLARKDTTEDLEFRDQGFTRPRILVILPSRNSCSRYIDTIVALCEPEQQENKKRFQDSYANGVDHMSENKPIDFRELFAGNDNDLFRLGMKFTRKTVKYFSQFYNSDIIFASPLGLRMALGADDPKKQDHDFLSSIEIVIVDQADAIAMQNWEHMDYIFQHLNLQPKETHGCDFSRVRHWYLDGKAKHLRQTILLSAFNFPTLNKVYTKSSLNVAGKLLYIKKVDGAIVETGLTSKQTFCRFDFKSPASEPDDRFNYFSTTIVPSFTNHTRIRPGSSQGILIFISSYADFVRVRNYLASSPDTQNVSFGSISEYTSVSEVARARSHFLSGRHSVLLYTERAHHFRRYHLKGVKKVIMYALPDNPIFYEEIVGAFLQASIMAGKITAREAGMRALFSRLDVMKLERIVGSSRLSSMLRDKGGDTFDFE